MNAPTVTITRARAEELDRTDPLAGFRERNLPATADVVAYLDGNSLGRPLARTQVILDRDNFPTNRYVAESLARDLDLEPVWLEPPADGGVTPEAVAAVVDDRTAVVTLSHIAYQSAYLADAPPITEVWDALELIRTLSAIRSD
jgi:kynureninase